MALVALDRIGRPGSTKDIMEAGPKPSDWEVLAGIVERVIYQNAENGFTVIRAKVRGHREPVTVVGHAAFMSAAERITATGERLNDPTYVNRSRPTLSRRLHPPLLRESQGILHRG